MYKFLCFVDDDSALSEVSLCTNGVGCDTTTTKTSEDEEEDPPPRKKQKISAEKSKNTCKSRNESRFGGNGSKKRVQVVKEAKEEVNIVKGAKEEVKEE